MKSTNAKAKKITIPDTITVDGVTYQVTSVADNAFKGNKTVATIKMGNNVTSIGKNAFKSCKKLTTVTIGKNVTTIGKEAFKGCKKLKKVTVTAGQLKSIGKNAFKSIDKKATIKVKGTKKAKNALKKKLKNKKIGYVKTWKIK